MNSYPYFAIKALLLLTLCGSAACSRSNTEAELRQLAAEKDPRTVVVVKGDDDKYWAFPATAIKEVRGKQLHLNERSDEIAFCSGTGTGNQAVEALRDLIKAKRQAESSLFSASPFGFGHREGVPAAQAKITKDGYMLASFAKPDEIKPIQIKEIISSAKIE